MAEALMNMQPDFPVSPDSHEEARTVSINNWMKS
jgi:hypothetical protein